MLQQREEKEFFKEFSYFTCGQVSCEIIHFLQLGYRVQIFSRSLSAPVREKTLLKCELLYIAAVYHESLVSHKLSKGQRQHKRLSQEAFSKFQLIACYRTLLWSHSLDMIRKRGTVSSVQEFCQYIGKSCQWVHSALPC